MLKPPYYLVEDRGYKTPCWVWQGGLIHGYGQISWTSKEGIYERAKAHRVYWERKNGPITEGLTIDHLCRVKSCVNPEHMEVVTQGENTRRGHAIIDMETAREIRREFNGRETSYSYLAEKYKVTENMISQVIHNRTWKEEK